MTNAIVLKSGEFLKSVLKSETDLLAYISYFDELEPKVLEQLSNLEKLIVWINIYNTLMQIELVKMNHEMVDRSIFTKRIFNIGGEELSLDSIEHGILRRNKLKQAFGYLPGRYLNSVTKKWKCDFLDARLHFQLNCGAVSCPMIRVLTPENIETELHEGEKEYILSETEIDHEKKLIIVSQLFLFYRKDFGGKANIKALINNFHLFPTYKLNYKPWNWRIHSLKIK